MTEAVRSEALILEGMGGSLRFFLICFPLFFPLIASPLLIPLFLLSTELRPDKRGPSLASHFRELYLPQRDVNKKTHGHLCHMGPSVEYWDSVTLNINLQN